MNSVNMMATAITNIRRPKIPSVIPTIKLMRKFDDEESAGLAVVSIVIIGGPKMDTMVYLMKECSQGMNLGELQPIFFCF